jgi:hypothetical protein
MMNSRLQNIYDDFKVLEKSSESLSQFLKADEQLPDILDQFCQRPDSNGSHRYFVEPYRSMNGSIMERNKFIPFPPEIVNQYKNVESASFMGILPEINRVWITIDNILYLWNYNRPSDPYVYDGISEIIVSVALTAPKPGIFLDTVRYLLVVATPVDISVLAVCTDEGFEAIRLSPTFYTLPSDNTTMVKIVGSQSGRIFMAGSDFNIYELEYSLSENSWSNIFGGEAVRKCRKVNHFATNWKLENIVPPLLRPFLIKEDSFADLSVDNSRNILYGISVCGCLNGFFLGVSGTKTNVFANSFDVFNETRNFLNNSRYAPEDLKRYFSENLVANGFTVLNVFPISVMESKKVHVVVVLVNGTRIYLSLQGIRGYYEPDIDFQNGPSGVTVVGVRAPPPIEALSQAKGQQSNSSDQGFLPTFDSSRKLNVTTSFYLRGVCFFALERAQQPDELLSLFEDNVIRGPGTASVPSLREGLGIDNFTFPGHGFIGKVFDIKELSPNFSDPLYSRLVSLYHYSLTPSDSVTSERSHHRTPTFATSEEVGSWFGRNEHVINQPPFGSLIPADNILPPNLFGKVAGVELGNSMNGTILSELTWQQLPAQRYYSKRQFAVLVNDGIIIFTKSRPSDALLDSLLRNDRAADNSFDRLFQLYGEKQASTMCLGLILGIPGDAGSSTFPESIVNPRPLTLDSRICNGLVDVVVNQLSKASYRATIAPVGVEADSRVVTARAASDFLKSTFHDAAYTVASRLLRPIWLRAVVENTSVASYWTVSLIDTIREPLECLQQVLLQKYRSVIESDGKGDVRRGSVFGDDTILRGQTNVQKEKELALQAKSLDDESIRNLYMLLSRSSHLLSLISVFLSANKSGASLAALNGFTFRSIVILSKVQDQAKKSVNQLITSLINNRNLELLSGITKNLSDNCYHFFSAGDVHTLKAAKLFDDIRRLSAEDIVGEDIHALMRECSLEFRRASSFWNSPEYISGDSSELRRACSWLAHLNEWGREAIVDVCLTAADNFISDPVRRNERQRRERQWDANLYHGGSITSEEVRRRCLLETYGVLANSITSYGSSQVLVGGGIVDWNNSSVSLSREKSGEHVKEMINIAVDRCHDRDFHDILYESLLASRSEALLRINSQYIESFLRNRDPKLLYKYYMIDTDGRQPQFRSATELMMELANEDVDRSIEERIECFSKALESATKVSSVLLSSFGTNSCQSNADAFRTNEELTRGLNDWIEIAEFQREIRDKLKSKLSELNANRDAYDTEDIEQLQLLEQNISILSLKLVDISKMFTLCSEYKVWDYNLILLHASRTNDAALIENFWKSFIYRFVMYLLIRLGLCFLAC